MTARAAGSGLLVVGIGNPDRGDDGFGPSVARRLRELRPSGVTIIERAGDVLALIEDWQDFDSVILVDAAANCGAPGMVHRIDVAQEDVPRDLSLGSTHAFGVAEAVALARALDRLPRHLLVYAVEARDFGYGMTLSELVAAAVSTVAERIVADIAAMGIATSTEFVHA